MPVAMLAGRHTKMTSNYSKHAHDRIIYRWTFALVALCLYLTSASLGLQAKEASLNAIVVYQNASGWTYLQASSVLVNAKTEMRDCGNEQKIDKSIYGRSCEKR